MDGLHLILRGLRRVTVVVALIAMMTTGFLATTGRQPLVERSGSMEPAISTGDVLVVEHRRASELVAGDVVTFAHPTQAGQTMTHRVMAVTARPGELLQITTKGDANPAGETWTIPQQGSVGVLDGLIPLPAPSVHLLDQTPMRGLAMALMCLVGLTVTLRTIWRRPQQPCVPAV